jgi:DNA-binding transcriptional ArsR family regulator
LIDRIRHDIEGRLQQLLAEAEKLRHALAALDPRERSVSPTKTTRPKPVAPRTSPKASSTKPAPAPASARAGGTAKVAGGPARTAPGATKAKVLAALSSDQALTAGDVAKATGLGRQSVSTTLSKLAKAGDVVKAERGYRLPRDSSVEAAHEPAAQ